jgi:hypothetical protein
MEDSLLVRLLKAVFRLLWKLFLNSLYLLGRLIEVSVTALNNLLKNYI